MVPALEPLHELLQLNSRLLINCLEGVDDETARKRINDRTNNIAFISSHIIDARYFLASYLGIESSNPFKELLEGLNSIEDFTEFPVVKEVLSAWREVSPALSERFESLTEAEIGEKSAQPFPIDDDTVLGGIAFLIQHESYHIGQLGFLRKCFELEAMGYPG